MRVHELARQIGVPSIEVLTAGRLVGYPMKSASSKIKMLPLELEAFMNFCVADTEPVKEWVVTEWVRKEAKRKWFFCDEKRAFAFRSEQEALHALRMKLTQCETRAYTAQEVR